MDVLIPAEEEPRSVARAVLEANLPTTTSGSVLWPHTEQPRMVAQQLQLTLSGEQESIDLGPRWW